MFSEAQKQCRSIGATKATPPPPGTFFRNEQKRMRKAWLGVWGVREAVINAFWNCFWALPWLSLFFFLLQSLWSDYVLGRRQKEEARALVAQVPIHSHLRALLDSSYLLWACFTFFSLSVFFFFFVRPLALSRWFVLLVVFVSVMILTLESTSQCVCAGCCIAHCLFTSIFAHLHLFNFFSPFLLELTPSVTQSFFFAQNSLTNFSFIRIYIFFSRSEFWVCVYFFYFDKHTVLHRWAQYGRKADVECLTTTRLTSVVVVPKLVLSL